MSELKSRETNLLHDICKKNEISYDLASKLLKTSKLNIYETKPPKVREKELLELITYYIKTEVMK